MADERRMLHTHTDTRHGIAIHTYISVACNSDRATP